MKRALFLTALIVTLSAGVASAQHQHRGNLEGSPHRLLEADANGDSAVTRAEFDVARDTRFAEMDANHDGQLSRGERQDARDRRRREAPRNRFAAADSNNDGAISRDEFLARPQAMFARLDANNDGQISEAEHRQARSHREDRAEARRARRQAGHADADHDRQISREEFAAASAAAFTRLDANRDGRISREDAPAEGGRR